MRLPCSVIMTMFYIILYLVIKVLIATNALYFSNSSTVTMVLSIMVLAAGYISRHLLQGNNDGGRYRGREYEYVICSVNKYMLKFTFWTDNRNGGFFWTDLYSIHIYIYIIYNTYIYIFVLLQF